MANIFIGLGTNQGDRTAMLAKARQLISERAGPIECESSVYETAAWGVTAQPDYYNQVLEIHSEETPRRLMDILLGIERDMGRARRERWGPRTIDLDILFYDDQIVDEPDLHIPHPRLHLRRFVLVPLAELAPDFVHPTLNKTVSRLLEGCRDDARVSPV